VELAFIFSLLGWVQSICSVFVHTNAGGTMARLNC